MRSAPRPAGAARARQRLLLARADRVGLAADRAVRDAWARLLAVLRAPRGWHADYARALAALSALPAGLAGALHHGLAALYHEGHALAAGAWARTLPRAALRRLAARPRALREDETAGGTRGLLTLAGDPPVFTAGDWQGRLQELIFPPPPAEAVHRYLAALVRPADWQVLGDGAARKVPQDLAAHFANLVSQGQGQREVALEIRPYLDGSRVRARRFARTMGLDVAHEAQLDADAGLGDLLVGYTVWAVKDEWTRKWHWDRSGTTYWRHPRPGQLGWDRMPRPPRESPDPRDRPPGTPALAWH